MSDRYSFLSRRAFLKLLVSSVPAISVAPDTIAAIVKASEPPRWVGEQRYSWDYNFDRDTFELVVRRTASDGREAFCCQHFSRQLVEQHFENVWRIASADIDLKFEKLLGDTDAAE